MKAAKGFPRADRFEGGLVEPFAVVFDGEPPTFENEQEWGKASRLYYEKEADRLLEVLVKGLPGGLVDAMFGAWCRRMASVFRVPHPWLNRPAEQPEELELKHG